MSGDDAAVCAHGMGAGLRARTLAVCCAVLLGLLFAGAELRADTWPLKAPQMKWQGEPQASAQLLMDSLDTPRVGEPLTLNLTLISQVQVPAQFQIRLSAPGSVELGAGAASLSGTLGGGERRTIPVVVTPKQLGDARVAARLDFLAEGAKTPFLAENSAVLRVRLNEGVSDIFVEQKEWPRKHQADEIKKAKASLGSATQAERDTRIRQIENLPADEATANYRVPEALIVRQQAYRQAAQEWNASSALLSEARRTALKQELLGSEWAGHIGSVERYADADGLVRRGVPVSVVYRKEFSLRAGETYTFETRNLTTGGDTVAYLFAYNGAVGQLALLARNDDGDATTLGSRIVHTAAEDGSVLLVVRSYTEETRGTADILVNGQFVERAAFAGVVFRLTADEGDALHTVALKRTPNRTDTLLLVAQGNGAAALWDDDGGMELGSKLVLPNLRGAELVLGAYSTASEGRCDLLLNTADGTFGAHPRGDLDGDGLSNELERALGTDPQEQDTDRDGLLDSWEALGIRDTDFPAFGTDGVIPDVFVQSDWMESTHNHHPHPDGIQMIMDSFAATGMNLHVDDGRPEEGGLGHLLPAPWTHIDFLSLGSATFRDIKAANFDSAKRGGLYRYNIFAHRQPGSCSSGVAVVRGFDFLVTLGCALGQVGSFTEQAGTFMHELGHNLGLRHGGFQDLNYKPNYRSVMNYLFQFPGTCGRVDFNRGVIFFRCEPREFFYSFGTGPDLDENCLDENVGVGEGPIDWNEDGQIDVCVRADINYARGGRPDGRFDVLRDNDDYANLFIPGAGFTDELKPHEEEIITCPAPPEPRE